MRLVWQFLAVAVVALISGQIVGAVRDNPWLSIGIDVLTAVMFRGVLFRIIEERAGTWVSLLVTSVLFGAWHLPNPDAGVVGAVSRILTKLGLRDRVQAVVYAYRRGLVA